MLQRPYRMLSLQDREAWEAMLSAPALTEVAEATDLLSVDRLEIINARPALVRMIAEEFPDRWAAQKHWPDLFVDAWADLGFAFDRGDLSVIPELLVDAGIYEAGRSNVSTALELFVWAALYRIGNLSTRDQSFFRPP